MKAYIVIYGLEPGQYSLAIPHIYQTIEAARKRRDALKRSEWYATICPCYRRAEEDDK